MAQQALLWHNKPCYGTTSPAIVTPSPAMAQQALLWHNKPCYGTTRPVMAQQGPAIVTPHP